MKGHKKIALLLVLCTLNIYVFGQNNCKVLMPEISETYQGKCKKGFAHGKGLAKGEDTYKGQFKKGLPNGHGIYTWSSGQVYIGDWEKGLKHGEGKLTFEIDGRDSIQTGLWEEDKYMGPTPKDPYKIVRKTSIDRFTFKRIGDGSRVLIDIMKNGAPNTDLENFSIIADNGTEITFGRTFGFDQIDFPIRCKLDYRTWNKLRTSQHNVSFEFEINQPGDWKILLMN